MPARSIASPVDGAGDGAGDACRVLEFYRADIAAERYRLGGGTANVERGVGTDIELPVAGDQAKSAKRPPAAVMVLLLVMGSLIQPLPVSSPPPAMVRPPDGGSMMLPPWRNTASRGDGETVRDIEGAGDSHVAGIAECAGDAEFGRCADADRAGVGGIANDAILVGARSLPSIGVPELVSEPAR